MGNYGVEPGHGNIFSTDGKLMTVNKQKLNGILFAMMGDDLLVQRWWNGANQAFDGQTPNDVFAQDPSKVRDYIFKAANLNGDYF